jgi:hypothetical protein
MSEFHDALRASEFQDLQLRCRRRSEEHLSSVGFFEHFGARFS